MEETAEVTCTGTLLLEVVPSPKRPIELFPNPKPYHRFLSITNGIYHGYIHNTSQLAPISIFYLNCTGTVAPGTIPQLCIIILS